MTAPRTAEIAGGDLFVCDNCTAHVLYVVAVKYRLVKPRETEDQWWCLSCVQERTYA